ncbi:MAG TPA: tetratricopeptide repeat protein [Stellaceae bacterium]|nr:tetratricopeptide repeat protein [Stellaceae bacterium]
MSELDIPMHDSLGLAAAGVEPRRVDEGVWQFPGATDPCFLHSSWRTGKTWFFFLFRHFPETMCFYEPFNEALASLTPDEAVRLGPQSWESGHPSTASYWREYLPLIRKSRGVRLFQPEMPYDWFIPVGGLHGDLRAAELKYLALLTRYAQRRRQIPVFGFSRSLGRIHPIKQRFSGKHIVIIKNLWDQWLSYLAQREANNPYFVRSIFRVIHNQDPFIAYLRDFYSGLKASTDDDPDAVTSQSSEQKIDNILMTLSDSDIFSIFVALHVYLYCNARSAADVLVDSTRLAADQKYREATASDLRELTGLRLSLTDAKETLSFASADHPINRDRIESHVRIAVSMGREGQSQASQQFAEELLEALYAKRAGNEQRFAPLRRRIAVLVTENERLQAAIAERDTAVAVSDAKADETETSLAKAAAELAMLQVQIADLERERDQRAASVEQLEAENSGLRARVGERDIAVVAAESRADAAAADLAKAQDELAAQVQELADSQHREQERASALAQVEAEAAGLRVRAGELAAVETRASGAEADLAEARFEIAGLRAELAETEREMHQRGETEFTLRGDLKRLLRAFERSERHRKDQTQEVDALRVEVTAKRAEAAAAQAQIRSLEVQLAEARRESETQLAAMRRASESELAEARKSNEDYKENIKLVEKERSQREAEVAALSEEVVLLCGDLSATRQVGRELIVATTADVAEQRRHRDRRRALLPPLVGPSHARAVAKGDRARDAKQWELAARHYHKALARDPRDAPCWVQYGHALKESGRLPEAEAAYRHALASAPAVADTHLQLGHVLKLQGQAEAAQAAYLRALALDPDMAHAREELAGLGWSQTHLARLCELSENLGIAGMPPLQEAADAARDRQDWAEAVRLYQEFVTADPSALEIAVQLGHALKEMGEFDRAAQVYYGVIDKTPLDDDLHLQIGHLEKLRRNYAAALTHYQRAAEINPNNGDARRECDALRNQVQLPHPGRADVTRPRQGRTERRDTDELALLDERAGEIYQQLLSAMA